MRTLVKLYVHLQDLSHQVGFAFTQHWKGFFAKYSGSRIGLPRQSFCLLSSKSHSDRMSFLLSFPIDLVYLFLTQWLTVVDVSYIDRAYCGREERQHLLESVFISPCCVLRNERAMRQEYRFMQWLQSRELRVRELFISADIIETCTNYVGKFGISINSIRFCEMDLTTNMCNTLTTAIFGNCRCLTSLICSFCKVGESILDILRNCTKLENVVFWRCNNRFLSSSFTTCDNHIAFKSLFANVTLDIMWESQDTIKVFQQFLQPTQIQRLHICCDGSTYAGNFISSALQMVEMCGLNLQCLSVSSHCSAECVLNTNSFAQMLMSCPHILRLNLSCSCINDASLVLVARHFTLLRSLNISFGSFTDASLFALAEHRKDTLESLFVINCENITAVGYNAVLRHCKKLHTMNLDFMDSYTAIPLRLLPCLLRNLKTLVIIGDNMLNRVLQYCVRVDTIYTNNSNIAVLIGLSTPSCNLILSECFMCYINILSIYNNQSAKLAALRSKRPDLHIRFEPAENWPSNV